MLHQPRLTQILNHLRDRRDRWPDNLPPPNAVIVHANHLPDDFDPDIDKLDNLPVMATTQIRKNSARYAYIHDEA